MADNVPVLPSTDVTARPVATDQIGGVDYQRVKVDWGPDGTATDVDNVDGLRLPVGGSAIGLPGETAPATDTASSGLNGRLQRIAQRLTSIFGDTTDAIVAAGATGSVAAKLRRLTNDIGNLTGARTLTAIASGTADVTGVGATAGMRLMSVSAKENAGTPAPAEFVLRHGTASTDPATLFYKLGSSESVRDDFGPDGIPMANGIWVDRISGTTEIALTTKVFA